MQPELQAIVDLLTALLSARTHTEPPCVGRRKSMPTKIPWCDETWNPVTGCTPISEGCDHCYAERMAKRLAGRCGYPKDDPFRPGVFHPDNLDVPLHWKKPRRIFVCSMGDLFHEGVSGDYLDNVLEVVAACPHHVFMVLTKRAYRIEEALYSNRPPFPPCRELGGGDYLPNLWLGVTPENQKRADEQIPELLKILAAVHFVSFEPLLSAVDVTPYLPEANPQPQDYESQREFLARLGKQDKIQLAWVIVGAETGPGARPMDLDWARSIRDQCQEAGVPFFFKRDSDGNRELDGRLWEERPDGQASG